MRFLFMPLPAIGHAFPMVPLAWALRNAGHEVTFLTGFDGADVRNAGFPVVDAMPAGATKNDGFPRIAGENPALFRSMAHLSDEEIRALKPAVVKLWDGEHDTFVAQAGRLQPDLIFFDPVFNAGLAAAAVLDVPAIGHNYMLKRYAPEFVREHAPRAFEHHGVDLPKKLALLDIGPPPLMEAGPVTWHARYVPYNGGGVLPDWLLDPPSRPRVAISLGTPLPHRTGTERFTHVLDAVRDIDADFALTVSESTAATLGPLPDNVRATGWVPLYELVRTCTAVIHHGGSGTMFSANAAGLPQLIIPQGADNDFNARAAERYGFALVGSVGGVDAGTVERLLTDDGLRTAAERLHAEMQALPTPADLVPAITEFAS
ncbi:nucleotide disphospho-sugar-binding domain-containing protein [Actinoplanes sp. N902-109]|uniref:nucleotide disphospho-sugar-binding domain-containing protein n=1 Tax=Actinoplanes sp. (strain N902-109) TaxID=649831 RepID=UPI0005A01BDB|nr:nucleotide disphospho-sugar-binding domain-containing protein [Actinoplanes sp. N902-109]